MRSDPLRVQQILHNLLSNAGKFTKNGRVEFSVRAADQKVEFLVLDTGIGMRAEQIDRLFKPLSQANSSTTRRFGGTGLGLAISNQFYRLMGGNIGVESSFESGTTFTVTLPAAQTPAMQPDTSAIPPRAVVTA
ncbi:MAG: hypothetical protein EXQ91_08150 [Alphaproteobacteria bacterium]|nr:hypothetical protein [Alphaproteobacteria bacterium]